jgi:hypothetical protein
MLWKDCMQCNGVGLRPDRSGRLFYCGCVARVTRVREVETHDEAFTVSRESMIDLRSPDDGMQRRSTGILLEPGIYQLVKVGEVG